MTQKVFRHIGTVLFFTVFVGAIAPVVQIMEDWLALAADPFASLAFYGHPAYWLFIFGVVAVIYPIVIYFKEINPRTFVHLYDVVPVTAGICLLIGGEVAALMLILFNLSEYKALTILAIIACGAAFLFCIYAMMCRGVAIYQKGKIRVFKFRIYTYHTDAVDDLRLEYRGKQCIVHVIVQGDEHLFRVSKGSAELIEKRLKTLKINGEIEESDQ